MNCKYTIKNFRVFDEEGATFDLRPITILTGCNSSGKSSVVKSIALLREYLSDFNNSYKKTGDLIFPKALNFSNTKIENLGDANSVLHYNSNDGILFFKYQVDSLLIKQKVSVEIQFDANKIDSMGNAPLKSISVLNEDNNILFEYTEEIIGWNFVPLIDVFCDYCLTEYSVQQSIDNGRYDNLYSYLESDEGEKNIDNSSYKSLIYENIKYHNGSYINRYHQKTKTIITSLKSKNFSNFSIFDALKNKSKREVSYYLKKDVTDHKLLSLIDKIFLEFMNSPCTSFFDYYKIKEKIWLRNTADVASLYFNSINSSNIFNPNNYSTISKYNYNESRRKWGAFISSDERCYELLETTVQFHELYFALASVDKTSKPYISAMDQNVMYRLMGDWFCDVIWFVLCKELFADFHFYDTTLTNIKKLYTLDLDGENTSLLKQYISFSKNELTNHSDGYIPGSFMNKWIEEFRYGTKFSITSLSDGLGVIVRIHKDNYGKGEFLAFQGTGVVKLFWVLLQIEIIILNSAPQFLCFESKKNMRRLNVQTSPKNYTICLIEPESHLHPSLQSRLADMIKDAYESYHVNFIVETHSEYLIRKLQTLVKNKKVSKDDVSIIYVDHPDPSKRYKESDPQVRQIYCDDNGNLTKTFGPGFFDVADKLALDLF